MIHESGAVVARRAPSLVDLCIRKAIDNLGKIGYVGDTDDHLLERILSHCTVDQLTNIEDSTKERDLSGVTNKLWKNFYEKEFGSNSTKLVVERMKKENVSFKWKQLFEAKREDMKWMNLYAEEFGSNSTKLEFERMKQKNISFKWKQLFEAKQKDMEEILQRVSDRIKQSNKLENERMQSQQVRFLWNKVPPSSRSGKRSFFGGGGPGSSICNDKSNLMKKARMEALNSLEVQNLANMRKKRVQRNYTTSTSRLFAPINKRF